VLSHGFLIKKPTHMQILLTDFQDQLVRGLSHRMNNILSLFHGYLGLLMDDRNLDTVTREGLQRIKDGARSASDLMERTNALVRPTSSIWREVHLGDLLRQMRPTFESFCTPRVKLQIECSEDIPHICADGSRVRLALIEIVRNACEAARSTVQIRVIATEGRVQGELFQTPAQQPEHWLKICVTDDGAGIPIEHAERIYIPFFSGKKRQQNAGLGLTVALSCAQQLNGTLHHSSHPGKTTFELGIPSRIAQELSAVA
jgi:signal transduction histidine kinase